jgi:hypothetical protein
MAMWRTGSYSGMFSLLLLALLSAALGLGDLVNGEILVSVPVLLIAASLALCAWTSKPPKWKGTAQHRQIQVQGAPAWALVFPFARGPFIASAACPALLVAAGVWTLAAGLFQGFPGIVVIGTLTTALFVPPTIATLRRLGRERHVALTPDLLCLQVPAHIYAPEYRVDVPCKDIEAIRLLPIGNRAFYAITLRSDELVPQGRWARRVGRRFGAHLFVQADWLTCHPDVVREHVEAHPELGYGPRP